jgi:hypothetical protein
LGKLLGKRGRVPFIRVSVIVEDGRGRPFLFLGLERGERVWIGRGGNYPGLEGVGRGE